MPQDQDTSDVVPFISNILTPGSSLHPTFLIVVDCTFLLLLLLFITLAILTSGNIHVLILMTIELCLWASVKWCKFLIYEYFNHSLTSAFRFIAELQVQSTPTQQEKKIQ